MVSENKKNVNVNRNVETRFAVKIENTSPNFVRFTLTLTVSEICANLKKNYDFFLIFFKFSKC